MTKRVSIAATVAALLSAIAADASAQTRRRRGDGTTGAAPSPTSPAPTAAASPNAAPPADPSTVEARREYNEGRALLDTQPEQALTHFRRAYELRSNPVVLLPIAEAQQRLGRVADEIATLEQYLRERADAPDRAAIEQRLAQLRTRPTTAHVSSDPAGAHVLVDGRDSGQTTPIDLPLSPGSHALRLELAGRSAFTQSVDAAPGGRLEINATLAPTTSSSPVASSQPAVGAPAPATAPAARETGPVVWVGTGLAAAGLVAGSVFGFMALGELSDYNRMPTEATRDRGQTFALLSDVSFGVAVLSAAVAAVVYFADRGETDAHHTGRTAHRTVRPRLLPSGVAITF